MAREYDEAANFPPVRFTRDQQQVLVDAAREVCRTLGWVLYFVVALPGHVHVIVGWKQPVGWRPVRNRFKRILGYKLAEHAGTVGRPWFGRDASRKHVRDRDHLDYLMGVYLPDHHGPMWRIRGWKAVKPLRPRRRPPPPP